MNLRKHATSLAVMHAMDVVQPLIILPYAAWALGPQGLGQFAYAMAIGQLASTIVDFGFHWTGQRAVSAVRNEPSAIAKLVAEIFATRTLLCILVVVAGLIATNGLLPLSKGMFLCAMLSAIGGIFFPTWLFIGLERADDAARAVVTARVLATILFLGLVKSPEHVMLAVAIQSGISILSALVNLRLVARLGWQGIAALTPTGIFEQLRGGSHVFFGTLVERVVLTIPVPLVEHFAGFAAAGHYALAEKFVQATRPVFRVIGETFMPRVAYLSHHDAAAGIQLIRTSLMTLFVGVALSLALLLIGPTVITIVFGAAYASAIPILRVMSLLPVLINANVCMATLYMFNFRRQRDWVHLVLAGLLTFVASGYVLCLLLPNAGIAVALALAVREAVILVVATWFYHSIPILTAAAIGNTGSGSAAVMTPARSP